MTFLHPNSRCGVMVIFFELRAKRCSSNLHQNISGVTEMTRNIMFCVTPAKSLDSIRLAVTCGASMSKSTKVAEDVEVKSSVFTLRDLRTDETQ